MDIFTSSWRHLLLFKTDKADKADTRTLKNMPRKPRNKLPVVDRQASAIAAYAERIVQNVEVKLQEERQRQYLRDITTVWTTMPRCPTQHDLENERFHVYEFRCTLHPPGSDSECQRPITLADFPLPEHPHRHEHHSMGLLTSAVLESITQFYLMDRTNMEEMIREFMFDAKFNPRAFWEHSFEDIVGLMHASLFTMWGLIAHIPNALETTGVQGLIEVVYFLKAIVAIHVSMIRRKGTSVEHLPFICTASEWFLMSENPRVNIAGVFIPAETIKKYMEQEYTFMLKGMRSMWLFSRANQQSLEIEKCFIACEALPLTYEELQRGCHLQHFNIFAWTGFHKIQNQQEEEEKAAL